MRDEVERETLVGLVGDVESLRSRLDDLWIEDRESVDEKLDMAFAAIQEWAEVQHSDLQRPELLSQLQLLLKDLHQALVSWRIKLDGRRDIPSSLEGALRDLLDRVMRLIV